MRARASTLALIVCFLASIALAQETTENKPALHMPELVHDLGSIFEQPVYKHTFIVENRGKADLLIEKVKPG